MSIIGIDLGTTTTVVARSNGERPRIVTDERDTEVFPSVVAYTPTGRVDIGKSAKARRLIDQENTLYSVKRIIGRSWLSLEVSEFRKHYPFNLENDRDNVPHFVTRKGKFTATDVTAHMIERLDEVLNARFAEADQVNITVPSAFQADQRQAIVDAAEAAGVKGVGLVDEPHAAALPYASEIGAGNIVVYDLGGGTFDLAVLRLEEDGSAKLLASGGDGYLGGDDIDLRIATWAADRILETDRWDVRSNDKSFQSLVFACERAKIRLSMADDTLVPLAQVDQVLDGKDLRLERVQLEKLFMDLVQRTFVICDEVMANAGVDPRKVHAVVLAGGGTYIPTIQSSVAAYFNTTPMAFMPPDRVVAMGAAMAPRG